MSKSKFDINRKIPEELADALLAKLQDEDFSNNHISSARRKPTYILIFLAVIGLCVLLTFL